MLFRIRLFAGAASCALLAAPLAAQEVAQDRDESTQSTDGIGANGEIVVTGERIRGQLDVEQAPIAEYNAEDIAAFGAGSVTDLVEAIANDTGSARGRSSGPPIFLVNGIRVASFREFRSYPPEAIRKVEVLPEEVAQRFGYAPDRRVINFILQDDYSSREIELEYAQPDRGGYSQNEQEFTLLKITDGGRINVNLEREDISLLTEAERDVLQADGSVPNVPGDPDPAAFRSLVNDSVSYEATVNYAKAFVDSGSSLSVNATYERDEATALAGLDSVILTDPDGNSEFRTFNEGSPLERRATIDSFSTAASYNTLLAGFELTGTVDASYSDTRTEIDREVDTDGFVEAAAAGLLALDAPLTGFGDPGFDVAETQSTSVSSKISARGGLAQLPAGELATTFDVGYDWDRIESEDTRTDLPISLTRGELSGGVSVVVPIASTRTGAWDAIGSLSLNGQARIRELSDFGTLFRWSTGLTWEPFDNLNLSATYVNAEAPPTLANLGNPQIVSLNVPTFDFRTGDTVLVDVTSGGNPDLLAESQSDWTFAANWELPFIDDTRATLTYVTATSRDVTSSFPLLTDDIEAAFPDRVTRDADGTLVALDSRPINLAEIKEKRLVFGLNTRGSIGPEPEREAGQGGRSGGRGGVMMMGRGNRDQRPRYFLSLTHTLQLENEVLIAPGLPVLDQLDGQALSSSGVVANSTRLEGGLFLNEKGGLRVSGTYTGPTRIDGSELPGSTDLFFDDLATLDLRLFVNLGGVFGKEDGLLKNARMSFRVDNVFDGRRRVTDEDGETPLSYQPFLIDPVGRYLGVEFRKLF